MRLNKLEKNVHQMVDTYLETLTIVDTKAGTEYLRGISRFLVDLESNAIVVDTRLKRVVDYCNDFDFIDSEYVETMGGFTIYKSEPETDCVINAIIEQVKNDLVVNYYSNLSA